MLTQPASAPVSIPDDVRRTGGARPRRRWRSTAAGGRGPTASSTRPPTGWRTCWPATARARVSLWRCCFRARPRRSSRSWRCSRPGRPICRSTRRMPDGADGVHARRRRADRRGHHRGSARRGWTGTTWRSSTSTIPPSTPSPAPHCRRRPRTTSPTSSTPRAPPGRPRVWRSPTTTSRSCWVARCRPAAAGRCGRSATPGVRLLGVGDLGRPAARWAAGGGARGGGALAGRLPRLAGRRTRQRA